jgi:hypothetical protein
MEGPHGSGGSEPPETIAFLKGHAWGLRPRNCWLGSNLACDFLMDQDIWFALVPFVFIATFVVLLHHECR